MTTLGWMVVVVSFVTFASCLYKGVFDLGLNSVRGRLYTLVGLGFFAQIVWLYASYNGFLWVTSRLLIALGTLQYILPYLRVAGFVSKKRWSLIFSVWGAVLGISLILAYSSLKDWVSVSIFIMGAISPFVSVWGTVSFWPAEIAKRWSVGIFAASFLWVADSVLIRGALSIALIMIVIYSMAMAAIASRRG